MTKKLQLILTIICAWQIGVQAQILSNQTSVLNKKKLNAPYYLDANKQSIVSLPFSTAIKDKKIAITGEEKIERISKKHISSTYSSHQKKGEGTTVGNTFYDLQTNSSTCRRILNDGNGNIHAMWTMGFEEGTVTNSWPDRGTGYNFSNDEGETWQAAPTSRLESTKTGWPNIGQTASGRLFSITHTGNGLYFTYKEENNSEWTEVPLGTDFGDTDGVWARVATSNDTIHAIIGRPPQTSSASGLEGGLLYFRSFDAGDTWEGAISFTPSFEQYIDFMNADGYAMDAVGKNVAFVYGNRYRQVFMYKSTDAGDTWQVSLVQATPNPRFDLEDALIPPTAASDGQLSLLLDHTGKAHVWFDRFFFFEDAQNLGSVYLLANSAGIMYWNEDLGEGNTQLIGNTVRRDYDGDKETFLGQDITYQNYGFSLVGHPSAGIDSEGNLYVAYDAIRDGAIPNGQTDRRFRDVYVVKSMDEGKTWQGPYPVSNDPESEDVYPSIARLVDDFVHILYQSDELTGTNLGQTANVAGTEITVGHPDITDNQIKYAKIPVNDIVNETEDNTNPVLFFGDIYFSTSTINNCLPDFSEFFAGHVIDYPEGIINENVEVSGVNVTVSGENVGDWIFTATDMAENQTMDTLLFGEANAITVLEDTAPPIIFPNFFVEFYVEGDDVFYTTFFPYFDTIDVVINTTYTELGAVVVDPPASNFDAPEYGNIYGCQPTLVIDDGGFDITTLGEYTTTYTATDINGNEAVPEQRLVRVIEIDDTPPEIILFADEIGQTDSIIFDLGQGAWEEPGYLGVDKTDGNITHKVSTSTRDNSNNQPVTLIDTETTGSYTTTYTLVDKAGNRTSVDRVILVKDLIPPIINIAPPTTFGLPCGTPYEEPGYLAQDNIDKELTDQVTIVITNEEGTELDSINYDCAGTYILTYSVTDSNGNSANDKTRNVIVTGDCDPCVVGVNDLLSPIADIRVYPNPSKGLLNIDLNHLNTTKTTNSFLVNVYDVSGNSVATDVYTPTTFSHDKQAISLDLSKLSNGLYFVKVTTAEGNYVQSVFIHSDLL